MKLVRALIAKDLHGMAWSGGALVLLHVAVAILVAWLLFTGKTNYGKTRVVLQLFPILTSIFLGHRLINAELSNRTWTFLSTLPVARLLLVTTKIVLGLLIVALLQSILACGIGLGLSERYALGLRELARLELHYVAYGACLWGFAIGLSMLGRYRAVAFFTLFFALLWVVGRQRIGMEQTPFWILRHALSNESSIYLGGAAQAMCWLLGGVLVVAAFLSARGGSVAERLAQQMSFQEKVVVAGVMLTLLAGLNFYDETVDKEPFELAGSIEVNDSFDLHLRPPKSLSKDRGKARAESLHDGIADLLERLQLPTPPNVFITHRSSLDATAHEVGFVRNKEGLLLRTNLTAPTWLASDFEAWAVQRILRAATAGAAKREDRRWAFEGLRTWWAVTCGDLSRELLELRACYGSSNGIERTELNQWYLELERLGPEIGGAVGGALLVGIEERFGSSALNSFLRSTVATRTPHNLSGAIQERLYTVPERFQAATGLSLDEFLAQWSVEQRTVCASHKAQLDAIPRLSGTIRTEGGSAGKRVTVLVEGVPDEARARVRGGRIPQHWRPLIDRDVAVIEADGKEVRMGVTLPDIQPSKSLLAWRASMFSEVLGCEVGTGWKRETLP